MEYSITLSHNDKCRDVVNIELDNTGNIINLLITPQDMLEYTPLVKGKCDTVSGEREDTNTYCLITLYNIEERLIWLKKFTLIK